VQRHGLLTVVTVVRQGELRRLFFSPQLEFRLKCGRHATTNKQTTFKYEQEIETDHLFLLVLDMP
jgi:hypothetical protein